MCEGNDGQGWGTAVIGMLVGGLTGVFTSPVCLHGVTLRWWCFRKYLHGAVAQKEELKVMADVCRWGPDRN